MLVTRVLLFIVFGLLMGGFVAANIVLAFRNRPAVPGAAQRGRVSTATARSWSRCGPGLVVAVALPAGADRRWLGGRSVAHLPAVAQRRQDFGTNDPYFNRDVGFFVFDLPWLHYVVNFAMMTVVLGLVAAIVVHYLFGGIRLQSRGDKVSGRRPGAVLGAARAVRAVQGRRLLARPLRPDHRPGAPLHRHQLHRVQRDAAVEEHPHVHRADLRAAVLRQRLPPHLAAARRSASDCWCSPRCCWVRCGRASCGSSRSGPPSPTRRSDFLATNIEATREAFNIADVAEQNYNADRRR